jgi:hypothetical protein
VLTIPASINTAIRQRVLLAARSILLGWAALLVFVYLLERPLLIAIAGRLDASWFPSVRLMLDCTVLAVTGWLIGRLCRASPIYAVAVFATTLTLRDFGELVEVRVPWLLQLAEDALRDSRYVDSLIYTAVLQTLLFGSLIGGALLTRRAPAIPSIVDRRASQPK